MNATGAGQCDPCSIGRYSALVGSTSVDHCVPCPVYTWSNEEGAAHCNLCPVGMKSNRTGSLHADACTTEQLTCTTTDQFSSSSSSSSDLCLYGTATPIALASIMPDGVALLADFLAALNETNTERLAQQDASNDGGSMNSSDTSTGSTSSSPLTPQESYSLYTASRTSPSLRLDAFGSDAMLSEYPDDADSAFSAIYENAAGESAMEGALSQDVLVSMLAVLLTLTILPLGFYRFLPARLSLAIDQFSLDDPVKVGEAPTRSPTQLGAAFTWSFLCAAALLSLYLASAPNTSATTALLPPSAVPPNTNAAHADMQVTLRVHSGSADGVNAYCTRTGQAAWYDSSLVSSQSGFSQPFIIRALSNGGTCSIAADCSQCSLTTPQSALTFTLPSTAQLIEWEVWVAAAHPGTAARRYGVLTQLSGSALMDASGRLSLSAIQSYYTDRTGSSTVSRSGYEIDFAGYTILTEQSPDDFTESSKISLSVQLEKSPIVFQTTVTNKLTTIQIIAAVLSAVISLFSVFALIVGVVKDELLPLVKVTPGRVVDERAEGGAVYILDSSAVSSDEEGRKLVKMKSSRRGKFHTEMEMENETENEEQPKGIEVELTDMTTGTKVLVQGKEAMKADLEHAQSSSSSSSIANTHPSGAVAPMATPLSSVAISPRVSHDNGERSGNHSRSSKNGSVVTDVDLTSPASGSGAFIRVHPTSAASKASDVEMQNSANKDEKSNDNDDDMEQSADEGNNANAEINVQHDHHHRSQRSDTAARPPHRLPAINSYSSLASPSVPSST